MTMKQFRTRVLQEAIRAKGQTIYGAGETERLNVMIGEQLDDFCSRSKCLPRYAVPASIGPSQVILNYGALRLARVSDVTVDGRPLANFDGRPGPINPQDLSRYWPTWQSAPLGVPSRWWEEGANSIRIFPTPDRSYSLGLTGFGLPTAPESDDDPVEIPLDLIEAAIWWCAFALCGRGRGYAAPEVSELGELAAERMRTYAERAVARDVSRRSYYPVRLGRRI